MSHHLNESKLRFLPVCSSILEAGLFAISGVSRGTSSLILFDYGTNDSSPPKPNRSLAYPFRQPVTTLPLSPRCLHLASSSSTYQGMPGMRIPPDCFITTISSIRVTKIYVLRDERSFRIIFTNHNQDHRRACERLRVQRSCSLRVSTIEHIVTAVATNRDAFFQRTGCSTWVEVGVTMS
jgi:hypothetical protein